MNGNRDNPARNREGYSDPTAFAAGNRIEKGNERFHKLICTILSLCDLAGFRMIGRITLEDKRTGKIWR